MVVIMVDGQLGIQQQDQAILQDIADDKGH